MGANRGWGERDAREGACLRRAVRTRRDRTARKCLELPTPPAASAFCSLSGTRPTGTFLRQTAPSTADPETPLDRLFAVAPSTWTWGSRERSGTCFGAAASRSRLEAWGRPRRNSARDKAPRSEPGGGDRRGEEASDPRRPVVTCFGARRVLAGWRTTAPMLRRSRRVHFPAGGVAVRRSRRSELARTPHSTFTCRRSPRPLGKSVAPFFLAVATRTEPVSMPTKERPTRRRRTGRRMAHSRESGNRARSGEESGRKGCAGAEAGQLRAQRDPCLRQDEGTHGQEGPAGIVCEEGDRASETEGCPEESVAIQVSIEYRS